MSLGIRRVPMVGPQPACRWRSGRQSRAHNTPRMASAGASARRSRTPARERVGSALPLSRIGAAHFLKQFLPVDRKLWYVIQVVRKSTNRRSGGGEGKKRGTKREEKFYLNRP